MPWRILAVCGLAGVVSGAILGLVRGLSYPPTVAFAIVEGAIIIGAPVSVLGLVCVGFWSLAKRTRHPGRS
ncbi:MAG TPA: hypothetical protein VNF71_12520 [Acidimicrobiales bacterium]|nr:hypothetical protein [Acidimicrobiales bacterium]